MDNKIYFHQELPNVVDANLRRVQVVFRILACGLGVLHVYAAITSQSMNADGIAYLDIGDAYFRGDWANAINPVWSPLYSWILGIANFVIRPSIQWEFPVIHLVNLGIYLLALSSFEFMWKRVRTYEPSTELHAVSDFWWWIIGYLLFIWISLSFIEIWAVTPDMLMAAFVFWGGGLIAQIRAGDVSFRNYLYLGLVLGLGYLSKTFMFAMAIIFLGTSFVLAHRSKNSLLYAPAAIGVFILISLPFILLISEKKGKITIGEAATVTYLRYANGMPFPHWQGDPRKGFILTHPSRIVHHSPVVYEFGEPIGGTYPISTDPSYWYEGIKPQFDFGGLLGRLLANSIILAKLFLQRQGIFLACVVALYMMGKRQKYPIEETLRRWALLIPAVVAFGLYATVLVEERYVGVFILLFWADILGNVRLPNIPANGLWLGVLSSIAAIGLLVNIIMFNLDGFTSLLGASSQTSLGEVITPAARPIAVAQTLQELGVRQGDKVGVIGYAYDSFWARLARVRIVSEMLETDAVTFWESDTILQHSVLDAFASTGAKAVIAEYVPADAALSDWHQVGESNYYIFVFRE
ncbi:MAG TPA: hypothetical protein VFQ23_04550 [Anaerolineales bacterium]|nr:hypothetical protein [Anaerolineales bacterium]